MAIAKIASYRSVDRCEVGAVADQRGSVHATVMRFLVEIRGAVYRGTVVPENNVARPPFVCVSELWFGREAHDFFDDILAFIV